MSDSVRKILWVFSSFSVGAPQRRFAQLVDRMGDDCQHVVCALDGDWSAEALLDDAARVRRLDLGRRKGRVSIGNLWSFRKALAHERPDLLVTSGLGAIEWLAVNRGPGAAPQVHFQDAIGLDEALEGADGRGDWTRRQAMAGRNRLFFAGCDEFETLLKGRWGAPPQSVRRMPAAVDLGRIRPVERSEDGMVVFGALGPLIPAKRHDRLLRILASLQERGREVAARIVGQGPERRRLEALAGTLGLADKVAFIDADGLDPEIAARETAKMDVYADLSDVCRSDEAAAVALAAGLPFLATSGGAAAGAAAPENAIFLRPAEDESALAAAAELLASDAGLRAQLGAASRAQAEARHDRVAVMSAYAEAFEEVMERSGRLMLPAPEDAARPAAPRPPQAQELQPTVLPRRSPKPTPPQGRDPGAPQAEPEAPIAALPDLTKAASGKPTPRPPAVIEPAAQAAKEDAALTLAPPRPSAPVSTAAKPKPKPPTAAAPAAPKAAPKSALKSAPKSARQSAPAAETASKTALKSTAPVSVAAKPTPRPPKAAEPSAEATKKSQADLAAKLRAPQKPKSAPSSRTPLKPTELQPTSLEPTPLAPSELKPTPIEQLTGIPRETMAANGAATREDRRPARRPTGGRKRAKDDAAAQNADL